MQTVSIASAQLDGWAWGEPGDFRDYVVGTHD